VPTRDLRDDEYRALAELRFRLREFLAFSEVAARTAALEPRQHQTLLALRGLPVGTRPTIGALAERLVLRHHTVVELVDRLERAKLVRRERSRENQREVLVSITPRGRATLAALSLAHREELQRTGPALVKALHGVLTGEAV
jgi:DNA-binding MarR family transcriptional regulator